MRKGFSLAILTEGTTISTVKILFLNNYGKMFDKCRKYIVARTGFEPVISALRGRRPKPLDERALKIKIVNLNIQLHGKVSK